MRVCFGQKIQYFFWQKSWYFWKMGKFEVPSDSPEEDELHELFQISIHQKILWRRIQWRFQCTLCALWPHDFLAKSRAAMHVESIHFPGTFEYECGDCGKRLSTKQALMAQSLKLNLVPHTQILGLFGPPKKRVIYGTFNKRQICIFCVFTPNYLSNKLLMLYSCVLFLLFTIACSPTLFWYIY